MSDIVDPAILCNVVLNSFEEPTDYAVCRKTALTVLPSAPMFRWISPFLLALFCNVALAAPVDGPSDHTATESVAAPSPKSLLSLSEVRQAVAEQATQVADNTSTLVSTAMSFVGVKYRRGGANANTGFDCSGFVLAIYKKTAGLVLPRRATDQAASTEVIDKRDLKPGDLVFFNTMRRAFSHVGLYLGEGKFIHSPRTGEHVRVDDMQSTYWKHRFNGARRVALDDQALAHLASLQVSTDASSLVSQ